MVSRFDYSRERNMEDDRRWNCRHRQVSSMELKTVQVSRRRFNNSEHEVELVPSIGKLGHADALTNGHLSGRCCTGSTLCQLTFPINNRLNNPLSSPPFPHLLATRIPSTRRTIYTFRTCCSSSFLDPPKGIKNDYAEKSMVSLR